MNAGVAAGGAPRHHAAPISAQASGIYDRRLDLATGSEGSGTYETLDADGKSWSTDRMIATTIAAGGNSDYDVLHDNNRTGDLSNVDGIDFSILAPAAGRGSGSSGAVAAVATSADQSYDYFECPSAKEAEAVATTNQAYGYFETGPPAAPGSPAHHGPAVAPTSNA